MKPESVNLLECDVLVNVEWSLYKYEYFLKYC